MWSAESSVKRRGSPSSLASEEPNPNRTDSSAGSSLITQLINDKFIKGLARVLAVDDEKKEKVGMAEKLIEGVKSEQGTLDLDAWKYFTSLPIWRDDKLIKECQTNQKYLKQQMQKMSDDPLLKPLFAEKEHIRVVLILLFWSQNVSPTSDSCASEDYEEFLLSLGLEDYSGEGCCVFNKSFDVDELDISLPPVKMMETLADNLMEDQKIVEIFGELLGTVDPSCSPLGALQHFDKVKEVWGNQRFVDHLLKLEYDVSSNDGTKSKVGLSKSIRSLIEDDILFEVISKYDDPRFKMRVALSILIGFWSNQDMIHSLVKTMGGGVKKKKSGKGKEKSPNTRDIIELYRDKSIWELAEQLKEEPMAVKLADFYLETLVGADCYCSYQDHFLAASCFWKQPSIILKFNEAMKKDSNLVKIFTKYSKGAEILRVENRLFHIRKDFKLGRQAIDFFDSKSKMRLALKILFGYWVDRDVTYLFLSLRKAKKEIGESFCWSENEKMEAFHYYARCDTDVEGLKNWLSNKYGKGSDKALSLTEKIGKYQKVKCEDADERVGPIYIQVVLKEAWIFTFSLYWFPVCKQRMHVDLPL